MSLVIKQHIKTAIQFQSSIEQSLNQLSSIASEFEPSSQKRREMSL
ncbi:DUF4756 family protein [Enterobacter roggenkampii]|nr:DUF4756 family protein [Enterobacter roggenkampii]